MDASRAQWRRRDPVVEAIARPVAAIVLAALFFALVPLQVGDAWSATLLTGLALAAHLMPVDLFRSGVRIVFTLPFVAAIAVTEGMVVALVAEVGVGLLVALSGATANSRVRVLAGNALLSLLSVGIGSLLAGWVSVSAPQSIERSLLQALAFVAGYCAANAGIVLGRRAGQGANLPSLGSLAPSFALYAMLALAVTALVAEGMAWMAPLALLPVWTLRGALRYQARMIENYCDTIAALNQMLQRAHPYTHGHLERVAFVAERVALRLGLNGKRARLVREAAILHDIGKIAVDEEILDKPGKLTPDEFDHVKRHSEWGAQILGPVREFSEIATWIRHHHERPDGSGYPDRLSDVEIPLESKIIAVVDAFDAMTGCEETGERRAYREPISQQEALAELQRCSGTQFDAKVVRAFRAVVEAD